MASSDVFTDGFTCFVCSAFIPGVYSDLTRHFKNARHFRSTASNTRADLICGQNGCSSKFETFSQFQYHIKVCQLIINRRPPLQTSQRVTPSLLPMVSEQQQTFPVQHSFDAGFEADRHEPTSPKTFDLTHALAKMMLKCRAFYNMTHEALNFVAREMEKNPLLSAVYKNLARNRKNYADGVARALDLGGNDASSGIVRDCVLNQSRYFQIADSEKQVMDAFHDFLEGFIYIYIYIYHVSLYHLL